MEGAAVTFADVGERFNLHYKNMDKAQQFTPAQRKALVEILKDRRYEGPRYDAFQRYDRRRETLQAVFLEQAADELGLTELIDEITGLQERLEKATRKLASFGFTFLEADDLGFNDAIPEHIKASVEEKLNAQLGTKEDLSRKFDLATVKLWTVEAAEEAGKIVETLLSVQ